MHLHAVWILSVSALLAAAAIAWVTRAYVRAGGYNRGAQMAGAAGAALAVLGVYMAVGSPSAPDQALAGRVAALEARVQAGGLEAVTPEELLAVLTRRAQADPASIEARLYSGLILEELDRDNEAARAFEAVLRRDGGHPRAMLELGRISARLNGPAHPATLDLFARAAELAPADPLPWFYQGLVASEQGRRLDAIRFWEGAQARFPRDDPRQSMIAQMLADARKLPKSTPPARS